MPIVVTNPIKVKEKKEVKRKEYSDKTKFVVVGHEHGRLLPHFVITTDLETGEERTQNIVVQGDDLTAKELRDFGIDIHSWLERELIALAQTYKGWYPQVDLEPIGKAKDFGLPDMQVNSE